MQSTKIENYTMIELLQLSYIIRDSLEYCHEPMVIKEEAFENRYKIVDQMLDETKFIAKFFNENPNKEGKNFYANLKQYFSDIYVNDNYLNPSDRKVDADKKPELIENTIKNFQTITDVINGFAKTFNEKEALDAEINDTIKASENFFRVLFVLISYNAIIKEDRNYKEALKETKKQDSMECKYIVNILKQYIAAYNFNRQRYVGDENDIIALFDEVFHTFQKLDGTVKVATKEELMESINNTNALLGAALQKYEGAWKQSYATLVEWIKNNPIKLPTNKTA